MIDMTNLQNFSINQKSAGNAVNSAQVGIQTATSLLGAPFADTADPFAVMLSRLTEETDSSFANEAPGEIAVDVSTQMGIATMPPLMTNIATPVLRQSNGHFSSTYPDETIHSTMHENGGRDAGYLAEGNPHSIGLGTKAFSSSRENMDRWPGAGARCAIFALTGQTTDNTDPALAAMLLQLHQEMRSPIASDAASATETVIDSHSRKTVSLTDEKQGAPGRNDPAPVAIVRQNAADAISARVADSVEHAKLTASTPVPNSAPVAFSYVTPYMPASNHAGIGQTIVTTLGTNGWAEDFSQKITWISTQKNQSAELHLNPPDLGQLNVVLKISDNQATAIFTSPHIAVREAVENALPVLREILADNGIMLGNATVHDQPPGTSERFMNQGSDTAERRKVFSGVSESTRPSLSVAPGVATRRHTGIVDIFA